MYKYTAFEEFKKIANGSLEDVILAVKSRMKENKNAGILIFSDLTGKQMDFDFSGSEKDVLNRIKIYSQLEKSQNLGAGRPKLGVLPREISLLPNHWEWLNNQQGGASATIRQLIDDKIKLEASEKLRIKICQEKTYKFLSAIAGDLPHFEEVIRYLYRADQKKFNDLVSAWPKDIVHHASSLAKNVFVK